MSEHATPGAQRGGMTLIEVLIAMVILSVAVLSMGTFVAQSSRNVSEAHLRATAGELVADRLEEIKGAGRYDNLETVYATTENPVPSYPAYNRRTLIRHVGGSAADTVDYKIVTVIVDARGLATPIKKSTIIAAY